MLQDVNYYGLVTEWRVKGTRSGPWFTMFTREGEELPYRDMFHAVKQVRQFTGWLYCREEVKDGV